MTIRRFLILAPTVLILFLLQSYLWVPTYEEQTRGNPDRLNEYITASIGDASILNPILAADSASSDINSMVFEGLIDRDEELRFRGRLATSWEIYEEAFFYVNKDTTIPGIGNAEAEAVAALLQKAMAGDFPDNPEVKASLDNIRDISVLPARDFRVAKYEKKRPEDKDSEEVNIRVRAPARIKLVLRSVDQDLFQNLTHVLDTIVPAHHTPAQIHCQRDNPHISLTQRVFCCFNHIFHCFHRRWGRFFHLQFP